MESEVPDAGTSSGAAAGGAHGPAAAGPAAGGALVVAAAGLTLRYPTQADAERLLELGSDPLVTRFFSWGPYARIAEPEAYIAGLEAKRERAESLEFVIDDADHGVVGVTGLSELSVRDRRATVGTWIGRDHWGSGANMRSKLLIAYVGFGLCGLVRLTAWANTRNGRSQSALERAGFRREGVLRGWHRHGDVQHDTVVYGLLRDAWERAPQWRAAITVRGTPPAPWLPPDA